MADTAPPDRDAAHPTRRLDNVLGYHLRRAQEAAFKAFAQQVGDTAVWPGWYTLLTVIGDNPGINQTALSQASDRDKSTLTAALRELVKAGLIDKRPDPRDRRGSLSSLTPRGQAHLATLAGHAREHDARMDAIVGPEHRDIVIRALRDLAEQLPKRGEDA